MLVKLWYVSDQDPICLSVGCGEYFRRHDTFHNINVVIKWLIWSCENKERYTVHYSTRYPNVVTMIQTEQGHVGLPPDPFSMRWVHVTEKECQFLWHKTKVHFFESIKKDGLVAGGLREDGTKRSEIYFSTMDYNAPTKPTEILNEKGQTVRIKLYDATYPPLCTLKISVQMARDHGCEFWQAGSSAVVSQNAVPKEALLMVRFRRKADFFFPRRELSIHHLWRRGINRQQHQVCKGNLHINLLLLLVCKGNHHRQTMTLKIQIFLRPIIQNFRSTMVKNPLLRQIIIVMVL